MVDSSGRHRYQWMTDEADNARAPNEPYLYSMIQTCTPGILLGGQPPFLPP